MMSAVMMMMMIMMMMTDSVVDDDDVSLHRYLTWCHWCAVRMRGLVVIVLPWLRPADH